MFIHIFTNFLITLENGKCPRSKVERHYLLSWIMCACGNSFIPVYYSHLFFFSSTLKSMSRFEIDFGAGFVFYLLLSDMDNCIRLVRFYRDFHEINSDVWFHKLYLCICYLREFWFFFYTFAREEMDCWKVLLL